MLLRLLSTANFTTTFAATFGVGGHQDAVVIVTLSNPSMSVKGGGITYTVAQSSSQAGVLSLESVYEGQGTSSDNSCSIFIDSLRKKKIKGTLIKEEMGCF